MSGWRLIQSEESIERAAAIDQKGISEPGHELNSFINSMASLIGRALPGL
jgi:hypothetical protein